MKIQAFALLASIILSSSPLALAEDVAKAPANAKGLSIESPVKEVVKITEKGLQPAVISLDKLDSSVFFLNATDDSLVSVQVNFANHTPHCASGNMKFETGVMKSVKPIGPKDFALMCFPESGTYDVTIEGVGGKKPLTGKVIIQ